MNNQIKSLSQLVLVLLILSLTACSAQPTAQTAVLPTASPSPTATTTATRTATPTVEPTPTETPEPSPTPPGYFSHFSAGFAVTYPTTWTITYQDAGQVQFEDQSGNLYIMMESQPEEEARSIEEVVEEIEDQLEENDRLMIQDSYEITLAENMAAEKAEVQWKTTGGMLYMWVIYTHHNLRDYTITLISSGDMVNRQSTIDRVLQSLTVFSPQPLGMPRDETLVLIGGEPMPQDLDPATTQSPAGGYVGLMFSGLTRLTPDLQVVPDLAEDWSISPDRTEYTFTLRENLQFSSGSPLTAQHVKDSWERTLGMESETSLALTYLGDIQGARQMQAGEVEEIEGVEVINERTLKVTLDGPKPYFLAKLTFPTAAVIDIAQAESDSEEWVFTADWSGPYQIKEYRAGEGLIFERNPHYHQPAGVPYLAYLFGSGGEPISVYEEGTVDILPLRYDDLQRISQPDDPLYSELATAPSMCTDLVLFNTHTAPLDDPLVRKALLLAVDREAMLEKLSSSTALLANGVLPPAMPGARPDNELPAFDPDAAREALAQSRYAGQVIELTLNAAGYVDEQRDDAAMLADMWQKNLGIQVKVEYLDPATYTETARENPGSALLYGWCADYPDPENVLDNLFHSDSYFNISGTAVPELDELLERARTETDPNRRLALYQEAETMILENVLAIPLQHDVFGALVQPRVLGYILSPAHARSLSEVKLKELE